MIQDTQQDPKSGTGKLRWLHLAEDILLGVILSAIVILPLLEIIFRFKIFKSNPVSSGALVQHLTLLVSLFGGMMAVREKRLLALATVETFFSPKIKKPAAIFCGAIGAMISAWLCYAGFLLVQAEKPAGKTLGYDFLPLWFIQSFICLGFGVITIRMIWNAADDWKGRTTSLIGAVILTVTILIFSNQVALMFWPCVIILIAAVLLGLPIFTLLGGLTMLLFWKEDVTVAAVATCHYSMVTYHSLATLPLFTIAGYCLAEGGASKRLIRVFHALFGFMRGGPVIVTIMACAFFTSFTGGSGVTILALAALLIPVLKDSGLSERNSIGMLTGAGSLGMLFPPCIPVILYTIIVNQTRLLPESITFTQMFLGGFIPGVLLMLLTGLYGIYISPKDQTLRQPFSFKEAGAALWDAKWNLMVPVVALGGIFFGWANMVESAALTAAYAFFVEAFIYRDLKLGRKLLNVIVECGLLVGGVLLILGTAFGFTNFLVDAEIPSKAVDFAIQTIKSPWVFLLALNIILLVVGSMIEVYAAIIVLAPLIIPLGIAFNIDPIHLGIIFLANLELGFIMPPMGLNLLLGSYRFNRPLLELSRSIIPILIIQGIGVLLITYIEPLTTWLPRLLGH